jgi:hypothetical protein
MRLIRCGRAVAGSAVVLACLRPEAALVRMQNRLIERCCAPRAALSAWMSVSMSGVGLHYCESGILHDPGSIPVRMRLGRCTIRYALARGVRGYTRRVEHH